jgi:hypothetical protein
LGSRKRRQYVSRASGELAITVAKPCMGAFGYS